MRSKDILDGVDFARDVPTPPEVSAFLLKMREAQSMDPHVYLEFLHQLSSTARAQRATSEGWAPFEL